MNRHHDFFLAIAGAAKNIMITNNKWKDTSSLRLLWSMPSSPDSICTRRKLQLLHRQQFVACLTEKKRAGNRDMAIKDCIVPREADSHNLSWPAKAGAASHRCRGLWLAAASWWCQTKPSSARDRTRLSSPSFRLSFSSATLPRNPRTRTTDLQAQRIELRNHVPQKTEGTPEQKYLRVESSGLLLPERDLNRSRRTESRIARESVQNQKTRQFLFV